jgi:hypothetical protein
MRPLGSFGLVTALVAFAPLAAAEEPAPPPEEPAPPKPAEDHLEACAEALHKGQREQLQGRLVDARLRFSSCAIDACPARIRTDCASSRADVEHGLPSVTFAVRDAQGRDLEARVFLDGVELAISPGRATHVDPGAHVVSYAVGNKRSRDTTMTVFEGERSRLFVITDEDEQAAAAEARAGAPTRSAGPWILGATGVAFVIVGAGIYALGHAEAARRDDYTREELSALGRGELDDAEAYGQARRSRDDAARRNAALGLTMGALGLAAVGSAIAWRLMEKPGGGARARVVPAVSPTFAGTSLDVAF